MDCRSQANVARFLRYPAYWTRYLRSLPEVGVELHRTSNQGIESFLVSFRTTSCLYCENDKISGVSDLLKALLIQWLCCRREPTTVSRISRLDGAVLIGHQTGDIIANNAIVPVL